MAQKQNKILCKCPKCGHKWHYKPHDPDNPGDIHNRVTCPSCGLKSPFDEIRIDNND